MIEKEATIGPHPWARRRRKRRRKGTYGGTLITSFGTRIPIPLNNEEEKLQLRETLQHNTIEKRTPPVPYLENVGLTGLEQ